MSEELTADDITPETEIVYQAPDKRFQTEQDYYDPVRGTVVEVQTRTIHSGPDSSWEKTVVVLEDADGETVETNIKNLVGETDYRVNIVPDVDDEDDDEDESEQEVAADGGEDVTAHVDDETIEDAIERHDDLDHPDALTIDEVRDLLADVQQSVEGYWPEHMDAIEDGALELVEDTGDVIVLADHTGHFWSEEVNALDVDDEHGIVYSTLVSVQHAIAADLTDHSWAASTPVVVRKPDGDGGQRYVEAVVNSLINEGLSPGQAWAVYGVHVAGHSRNAWSSMCGYSDHSAVSEPLRKVNEKTPYIALLD